jgi:hypothetical protein
VATTHALNPTASKRIGQSVAIALALVLLMVGVVWTVPLLLHRDSRGTSPALAGAGPFAIGESVRTAMGVVTVSSVERMGGLTSQDMAGANHNIQNLVPGDKAQVQVNLRITDDTGRALAWEAGRVTLQAGESAPVVPLSSTLPSRQLGPGTSVEGTLGFVAPRDGSRLVLRFPAADGGVTTVDLGATDSTPAVDDGHHA